MNYGIKTIILALSFSLVVFALFLGFNKAKKKSIFPKEISSTKDSTFQEFLHRIKRESIAELEMNYSQKFNCKSPCSIDSNK